MECLNAHVAQIDDQVLGAHVIWMSFLVDMSRNVDISPAAEAFSALSQPTRLTAFRRLIAAYPGGLAAGEIARLCGVPHNTMSSHLAMLSSARLVTSQKQGRVVTYSADLAGLRRLVLFLTRECCGGRADICAPLIADIVNPYCSSVATWSRGHDR